MSKAVQTTTFLFLFFNLWQCEGKGVVFFLPSFLSKQRNQNHVFCFQETPQTKHSLILTKLVTLWGKVWKNNREKENWGREVKSWTLIWMLGNCSKWETKQSEDRTMVSAKILMNDSMSLGITDMTIVKGRIQTKTTYFSSHLLNFFIKWHLIIILNT